jgi:hypothetical protein
LGYENCRADNPRDNPSGIHGSANRSRELSLTCITLTMAVAVTVKTTASLGLAQIRVSVSHGNFSPLLIAPVEHDGSTTYRLDSDGFLFANA